MNYQFRTAERFRMVEIWDFARLRFVLGKVQIREWSSLEIVIVNPGYPGWLKSWTSWVNPTTYGIFLLNCLLYIHTRRNDTPWTLTFSIRRYPGLTMTMSKEDNSFLYMNMKQATEKENANSNIILPNFIVGGNGKFTPHDNWNSQLFATPCFAQFHHSFGNSVVICGEFSITSSSPVR